SASCTWAACSRRARWRRSGAIPRWRRCTWAGSRRHRLLELTAINAGYGHGRVVKDIALRVEPGEAVALLGRNGVGKTTLLRTIVGLHPARSGAIRWNGADITRAPAHRRAALGIAYVPQGRGIFPHLTVEENLRLGTTAAPAG